MAAHCLGITAITSVLSECLDVVDEIKFYQTCSTVYSGNKVHRDILQNLRKYYWGNQVILTCKEPRIKELVKHHPMRHPFTEYVWRFVLKSYMIVILASGHLPTMTAGIPTDQKLVAGDRGDNQISINVVTDSAAYLHHDFVNESDPNANPGHEFIANLPIKWKCMALMIVMMIVCVSGCLDTILVKELLFHPYC